MKKFIISMIAFLLGGCLIFRLLAIRPGYDPKLSFAIADSIATDYDGFSSPTSSFSPSSSAYSVKPLNDYGTRVTVYGVTNDVAMMKIAAAANIALSRNPDAKFIDIRYYQAQVFTISPDGQKRDSEVLLKSIILKRGSE